MCGLVGYVGLKSCIDPIFEGLRNIEYRGYDSTGFVSFVPNQSEFFIAKTIGGVANLHKVIETSEKTFGCVGIGQTRWATHGAITVENAHPHSDCTGLITLAHNGIIENYKPLKEILIKKNHHFRSETDTEIVSHLFEEALLTEKNPLIAWHTTIKQLQGAFSLIALYAKYPNQLFIARLKSALYVGIGNSEFFIASDTFAFEKQVKKFIVIPEETFGTLSANSMELFCTKTGSVRTPSLQSIAINKSFSINASYPHEMLREIIEGPEAIRSTINNLENAFQEDSLENILIGFNTVDEILFIGCGTSWHAAGIGAEAMKYISHTTAHTARASEFRYEPFFPNQARLHIFISQSGETADTLEALRFIKPFHSKIMGVTNIISSSLAHETSYIIQTQAGREIAVASTKAFMAQIAALLWYAHKFSLHKHGIHSSQVAAYEPRELIKIAAFLETILMTYQKPLETIHAPYYSKFERFLFLGKGVGYWIAAEAALKLKEISYCFAEAHPAGELKHGVIALIDEQTPTCLISSTDQLIYKKLISTAHEIKSRNGHLMVIAAEGQTELIELADTVFVIPHVAPLLFPVLATGLLHLFAYYCAVQRGCPIDKPRNLAKSVTVE